MKTLGRGAILILAVAVVGFADEASAEDYFGAIAYSPSSGADGYSFDNSTQDDAEARALAECKSRGDGGQSVLWFRTTR